MIARRILGMANRSYADARRHAAGCGYLAIGAEPGAAGPHDRRVASAAVCVTTCYRAVFLLRQRVLAPESERPARALAVARAPGPDEIHAAG
jgi:hypothetical protein